MKIDRMDRKLNEACAVVGVSLTVPEAAGVTYNGLLALQHRGQEGAGIAVVRDSKIVCHKDIGLVSEVFTGEVLATLSGCQVAVGHTRYATTGSHTRENVGPFITEYLTGRIVTAHNGNLTNAKMIRETLWKHGLRFGATSDSEVLSSLIAYCITVEQDTMRGVTRAARFLQGAFSLVIANGDHQLIAVRDANGYRPLCIGRSEAGLCVASESCALDAGGFTFVRDVQPGEIVVIENGAITRQGVQHAEKDDGRGLCIFEYIYFARPDSVIDGLSVYQARFNMGAALAAEHPVEADAVCGVPDSGLDAAYGYSAQSGIPLVPGFVKNRYMGRSFIYPTQTQRDNAVRLKLNPLSASVAGKRIVLVDDSIVRGTTSAKIVKSLRAAGAKAVHMRVSSPPFRFTCHYGTDIDSEENLIANKRSLEAIRCVIDADSLGYISLERLKQACGDCALPFCTACFTGYDVPEYTKKDIFE